jgi:mannose-6-phosphate isomerase
MPNLYPLLLCPEFHERVWGSTHLAPFYTRQPDGVPVGEVWLTGDNCRVANGPLAGRTLAELSREYGSGLLGDSIRDASRFPLLTKFLFPRDKLSVQVHPDDEAAALLGQPCGKTECWYILQAEPGAQIGLGLKPGTSKAEVEQAIREVRMEELLNWIDVRPGEMYYVDAGTIHAIGPGAVIVETQQNSDITYRLYDYGRPRTLHIADGLRAAKEQTLAGKVLAGREETTAGKTQVNLIRSRNFIVDKFRLEQAWQFQRPRHAERSVWCLVATAGCGVIESPGAPPITFATGEAVIIPAAVDRFILKPQWDIEFLCSSLPVEEITRPAKSPTEIAAVPAPEPVTRD